MFQYKINDELSLTLVHSSFASQMNDIVNDQKDDLGKWLPWANDFSENSYREFVKFALHQYADDKAIHTHIIYDDKIIGAVSLNNIYHHLKKAEIGYWLHQDHRGRGVMTCAVRAIMDIAKNIYGMNVVEIKAGEHNIPSQQVAKRLGFEFCGIIANHENINGEIINHAVYMYRF